MPLAKIEGVVREASKGQQLRPSGFRTATGSTKWETVEAKIRRTNKEFSWTTAKPVTSLLDE